MIPIDPLTAALNLGTAAIELASKVWDATPAELRIQNAADWAKFTHNIGAFIVSIQGKINAATIKSPPA